MNHHYWFKIHTHSDIFSNLALGLKFYESYELLSHNWTTKSKKLVNKDGISLANSDSTWAIILEQNISWITWKWVTWWLDLMCCKFKSSWMRNSDRKIQLWHCPFLSSYIGLAKSSSFYRKLERTFGQPSTYRCCCLVAQLCSSLLTPWMAACQASLSLTISWSLPKFMSIALAMPWCVCDVPVCVCEHRWCSAKESTYQRKRRKRDGFDPWVRKISCSRK